MHRDRSIGLALGLVAALAMSACRFDTTLDDTGGGTIKLTYRVGKDGSLAKAKRNLLSPHVKIVSAAMDKEKRVTAELAFDAITQLSTARMFNKLQVTRTVEKDGTVVLAGKLVNEQVMKVSKEALDYFGTEVVVTVTTPGEIVKTNATATAGKTATWTWPMETVFGRKETLMQLSYKGAVPSPAATAAATPAGTPSPAPE